MRNDIVDGVRVVGPSAIEVLAAILADERPCITGERLATMSPETLVAVVTEMGNRCHYKGGINGPNPLLATSYGTVRLQSRVDFPAQWAYSWDWP